MGYKDIGIRKSEFVTKTPITLNDSNVSQIYEFFLNFFSFRGSVSVFTVNRNQAFFVKIQVLIPPLLQKGKIEKNVYEISVNKLV